MSWTRNQKNKNNKQGKLVIITSSLTCIFLLMLYLNLIVNPVIMTTSESKVRSLTLKAVNSAVADVVSESILYNDLISIVTNNEGDIVMMQANSIMINRLSKELVKNSQSKLENIGKQGVSIPLGNFSGMPILVGRGPEVKIRLLPIGAITCSFDSQFTEAGINQTLHRIYVNIEAVVTMIMPLKNRTISNNLQVLISESILIGKIPSTFLKGNLSEMLDLIP